MPFERPPLPSLMRNRLRPDVLAMQRYLVQPSQGLLKMDAMENPHRLPLELQQLLGARLGALELNRYPGLRLDDLRAALAAHAGVPQGFELVLGNGSDELISMLAMAFDRPGACVLAPVPGFVMYGVSAQLQGLKFVGVPLNQRFELDEPAMLAAIMQHQPSLIYLAYPNNPTANLWDEAVIDRIIAAAPGFVVLDEAYQPFAAKSYMGRIAGHEHVLLMRTLSKFGLAGVRVGYLAGPAALVRELDKVRPPYNISVLNAECALFALEHASVFAGQAAVIRTERDLLLTKLADLPDVQVFPSQANMLLLRLSGPPGRAAEVFEGLKARRVLVKNVSTMHPLLANCLRLTVGSTDQNAQLLAALRAAITQGQP